MPVEVSRPSDARRAALTEADATLNNGSQMVSNFFPIERYYEAADKVLTSFYAAYSDRRLDDAYVYGKRFAKFSLDALPSHNYYKSSKYSKLRKKNNQDMTEVIMKLESIAQWMDKEEAEKEKERQRREAERRRREEERIRRIREEQREAERRRYKEWQDRVNQQKQHRPSTPSSGTNVAESALSKLNMLNGKHGKQEDDEGNELLDSLDSFDQASIRSTNSSAGYLDGRIVGEDGEYEKSLESTSTRRSRRIPRQQSDGDVSVHSGSSRRRNGSRRGEESSRRRRASNGEDFDHRRKSVSPKPDSRIRRSDRQHVNGDVGASLPPPILPPTDGVSLPPPPSYNDVVKDRPGPPRRREPVDPSVPSYANREAQKQRRAQKQRQFIPMRKIKEKTIYEYRNLKQEKRIEVFPVDTYQGRLRHSVNGCAVISPLVVSHHLRSSGAVANSEVVGVIDKECGPLLREIRGKLELGGDALIIPSDVHDHLVDKKILSQGWFVGATGGNIMDVNHVGEFLKLLDAGEKNSHVDKKTGAALFFREHVVSIVKVPVGRSGKFYFDLIDSMPGLVDTSMNRRMATRTRCKDIAAFETLIRWYAATKFSESNCNYIDKNDWDETMADFDPRVFQAFVWGEAIRNDSK